MGFFTPLLSNIRKSAGRMPSLSLSLALKEQAWQMLAEALFPRVTTGATYTRFQPAGLDWCLFTHHPSHAAGLVCSKGTNPSQVGTQSDCPLFPGVRVKTKLPMVKSINEPQPARTLIPSSIITQESQLRKGFSAGDASAYLLSSKEGPFWSQRRDHLHFFFTVK